MLGTVLWNSGALGNVAAYNLITPDFDEASLASSRVSSAVPVEPGMHTPEIMTGRLLLGWLGDFYFRVHITTLLLDLGNLVTDQTTNITLWNAHRRSWTLSSIALVNAEGITVTGQPAPPLEYAPLQERTYSIGISTDGPSQIDATIEWVFSSGEEIDLSVVGQRIVLWAWRPDWQQGLIERLQWYTNVIEAGRGEEQRRSLRVNPRQYLEFSTMITENNRRIMESVLWNWGARAWAVPLWFDGLQLSATLAAGSTVVPINPTGRGYQVGELLVLLKEDDPQSFEVLEVDSLSTTVTLARPTSQSWPAGTWVYPARAAMIENAAEVSRFDGHTGSLRVQWRMLSPTTWAAAATPTYRSMPVLEHLPNWTEDPALTFNRKLQILDAGIGPTRTVDKAEMPLTVQKMRYTLMSKAQIDTWKKRLWALRGKQGSIWVPTWAQDLQVVLDIADTANTIDVKWLGYTEYLVNEPNRQDIRIQLTNGTVLYRRITGSTEVSASVERLSIDSSLGVNAPIYSIAMVSFMGLSRSDSDVHELSYFTGEAADTAFSARGFRHAL